MQPINKLAISVSGVIIIASIATLCFDLMNSANTLNASIGFALLLVLMYVAFRVAIWGHKQGILPEITKKEEET